MTKEIKFNDETKETESPKYRLLKRVFSQGLEFSDTGYALIDYDYYMVIEQDVNRYTIVCWNDGDNVSERIVYIAELMN